VGRRLVVLNEWERRGVLGTGRWIGVLCCECEYLEGVEIRSRMLNTLKRRIHEYIWRGNFNEPRPMNETFFVGISRASAFSCSGA
jgi:hypothetical protein